MKKRLVQAGSAIVAVTLLTTGCGSPAQTPQAGVQQVKEQEKPTPISIVTNFVTTEPPGADNVIVKEVEKRTNTQLNISWNPTAKYDDKVSVILASGDIPDLMLVLSPFTSQMRQLVDDGAFWDLTDLIKDYPNLSNNPKDVWTNTKMQDGRNYGIPRARGLAGGGYVPAVRMDWLDKLNLKVPETIDDLYNVMKAFKEKDPDGNGKDDTYGLVGDWKSSLVWIFNAFTGTSGSWKASNGKLIHVSTMPEMRDALVWFNKIYAEDLVPKDFVNTVHFPAVQELVAKGKAGLWGEGTHESYRVQAELNKTSPDAELRPLSYVVGPQGKWASKSAGFNGMYLIPKKSVSKEKLAKILAFMDYGASDEGHELGWYGFKDVHFTEKDGFKFATEQAKKDNVSQQAFGQIFGKYDKYQTAYFVGIPTKLYERNKKIIDTRLEMGTSDSALGLYSETNQLVGSEITKRTDDLMLKVVIGKEPIQAWDVYVAKLKEDKQFQKIVEEMNASYQKRISGK